MNKEQEMIIRAKNKDNEAVEWLLKRHEGLMHQYANRFSGGRVQKQDVFQDSFFALMSAINKYDPDKGIKFSSYLAIWMKSRMYRFTLTEQTMVYIPNRKQSAIAVSMKNKAMGLDYNEDDYKYSQLMSSTGYEAVQESDVVVNEYENVGIEHDVDRMLKKIGDKEVEKWIRLAYGIGCPKKTYAEIGKEFGKSKQYVNSKCSKVIKKLKHTNKELKVYIGG